MASTLFQQFLNLVVDSQDNDINDVTTYDVLVDVIFEEVDANVTHFSHQFDHIFSLFSQLLQTYQTEGTTLMICSNLYEIFVILVERRPTLIKKKQNRLLNIVQKLLEMFNCVDFQSDENWMKPIEGYSDENDFSEDCTLTKQIMSYVDRMASAYNYQRFVEFFSSVLSNWWTESENNWKLRYSLLMVMSQLGENVDNPLTINSFIDCGIQSASHPNPKVRYGALQMFGQLADDMKPEFQLFYGQKLLPVILGCTKDEVPRVHGHAMACLTNFLEEFQNEDYHILTPYVDEIINVSESFCHNGISLVKQNTISTLASLSTIQVLNASQVQRILNIIHFLLTLQLHQKQQYDQLMNQTAECLSMVLYGQKEKVQNVFIQSVNVLKSLKTRISPTYLVNSWSRICLSYENFTDLSDIFPQILLSVAKMIQNFESELESAISSIRNTITSFKENIKPYANDIIQLCKNGSNKLEGDSNLKASLYEVLNELVITLKSEAPDPQWEEMSKNIFTFLYQQVQKILDQSEEQISNYESLEVALKGLQKCVLHVKNLITGQNSTVFSQNIFNFATKITELIQKVKINMENQSQNLNGQQDEIVLEDIQQVITIYSEKLQNLLSSRLIIPDIFESILKLSSKESQGMIVQSLYPYISTFLQNGLPNQDIRYGLYFLCDFLTALKYEGIEEHANVYESKFAEFCLSPNLEVRNCAVFGLGEFMKLIPVEKTDQNMIFKWLNLLWNSLTISNDDETDKKRFGFARDNIVSALGKLIYSKRTSYPVSLNQQVHKKWFQNLPLSYDKTEGNIQHEILLDLLQQTPETFISTKQDILKILTIFAKYFSKRMNKTGELVLKNKKQSKDQLFKMKDWPIFQQNSEFLWNSLSSNHREILTQLMSAP